MEEKENLGKSCRNFIKVNHISLNLGEQKQKTLQTQETYTNYNNDNNENNSPNNNTNN